MTLPLPAMTDVLVLFLVGGSGAVIGSRYRAAAMVVASAIVLILAVLLGVTLEYSSLGLAALAIAAVIALQVGYLAGVMVRLNRKKPAINSLPLDHIGDQKNAQSY
jgi:CHASE2 domain-containing sensor protein